MWKDVVIGILTAVMFLLIVTSGPQPLFTAEKCSSGWTVVAIIIGVIIYQLCRWANREYFDGFLTSPKVQAGKTDPEKDTPVIN